MRRPPSRLPSGLASLGSTTSTISDCDSRTGRGKSVCSEFVILCKAGDAQQLSIVNDACVLDSTHGPFRDAERAPGRVSERDRKSTRLNSSHVEMSYAVFCLKTKMDRGEK